MKDVLRVALRWALRLLGPALLLYFLLTIDLGEMWAILKSMNPWWFLLSCVTLFPFLFMKGWRWQLILKSWNMPINLVDATALYSVGIFLGNVTPGQAGDAVKAWYLKRRGYPLAPALLSIIVDRFFDVAIMGLAAASGLFFFREFLPTQVQWLLTLVPVGVVVGLIFLGSRSLRAFLVERVAPRVVPRRLRELAGRSSLSGRSLDIAPAQLALITFVSAAGLLITFVRLYFLFIALDQRMPIGPYIALIGTIALVQIVSIGGIGTRDAVMLSILPLYGIDKTFAFTISTLFLLLNVLAVVTGFLVSLRYPIAELRQEAERSDPDEVVADTPAA
jgi:uncharacterized protein (TIRG00374 family)